MNLPNKLTLLRIIMIPFYVFFHLNYHIPGHMMIAFLLFAGASLTDMLDGQIARKHNLVTDFGKLMDPLADKLLVMAALVCVLANGYQIWPVISPNVNRILAILIMIIVLGRDMVINAIRLVAAGSGVVIAADIFGKLKTIFQMVWLCVALLRMAIWSFAPPMPVSLIETALLVTMLFFTLLSGYNYVWQNRHMFADA